MSLDCSAVHALGASVHNRVTSAHKLKLQCMGQFHMHAVSVNRTVGCHEDFIKWKHFPRYRPFVRGIHRSPVNSPHKGQWREALVFSLICAWINAWVNDREAGDLRRHSAHYDVTVICSGFCWYHMNWYDPTQGIDAKQTCFLLKGSRGWNTQHIGF